ncbi:hypothetical protein ACWDUL_13675 [Nocardia niigatensis]|uniref:hypothetical protein n=1 Tax=Nocardia niigatensis TaxID=209249 RepID=UPI0005931FAB|nr:hypothetical protein [Nocardia niigatensis]
MIETGSASYRFVIKRKLLTGYYDAGADGHQSGGRSARRADHGGLRSGLRVPLPAAGALPAAFVAAEPAPGGAGGVYKWVGEGISRPMGFLAVWCRFAMTIFYHPSLSAHTAE